MTKPKPRERRVSLSNMTTESTTSPNCSKNVVNSLSTTVIEATNRTVYVRKGRFRSIGQSIKCQLELTVRRQPSDKELSRVLLGRWVLQGTSWGYPTCIGRSSTAGTAWLFGCIHHYYYCCYWLLKRAVDVVVVVIAAMGPPGISRRLELFLGIDDDVMDG